MLFAEAEPMRPHVDCEWLLLVEYGRLLGKAPAENHVRLSLPAGFDAHDAFPQELEDRFRELGVGVDIHDSAFGAWWKKSTHRKKAKEYNRRWDRWLTDNSNAALDQMIDYGRELADDYKFIWGF